MINFGFIPSPPDERDWPLSKIANVYREQPEAVSMRHLVEILNQGFCGTCVAFAGVGALNAFNARAFSWMDFSELFLYKRCKELDGIPFEEGTYPRVALQVMKNEGVCPQELLPYSKLDQTACMLLPTLTQEQIQAAAPHKIKAYARLNSTDEMRQALADGKLLVLGVLVTESFIKPINGIIQEPNGSVLGLHAMLGCGYTKTSFEAANSWSIVWGDKGFCYIPNTVMEWKSDIGIPFLMEVWALEVEFSTTGRIEMQVGSKDVIVDGQKITLDVAPTIIDGRTMVPIRFVSEALGASVHYDSANKRVLIMK